MGRRTTERAGSGRSKAGRGGRVRTALAKRERKSRLTFICTSSGSEDFGMPYDPRERVKRKKLEREAAAKRDAEESEEERTVLEVSTSDENTQRTHLDKPISTGSTRS